MTAPVDFTAFSLVTRDGRRLVRRRGGAGVDWVLVPEAELPPDTPPPRRWTIYGVKSAHSDLGLHRSNYVQRANATARLARAMDLLRSDARPDSDPAALRWVAEGWWGVLDRSSAMAGGAAEVRAAAAEMHRRGRFDVGGNWCGLTTHLMGFEELCRSLCAKREVEERFGIRTKTAQIVDNPGVSSALVGLYAQCGIRYLAHWPNPYTMGLDGRNVFTDATSRDAPSVFWWEAPDGKSRVLVWTNADGYVDGAEFGLKTAFIDPPSLQNPDEAERVPPDWKPDMPTWERTTAERLAALERAVPYNVWLYPDYHDDEVPSTRLADAYAAWNEKWAMPVFRTVGSLDEPFERLERDWGDRVPVLRGDLACGWDRATPAFADVLARKFAVDRALPAAEARAAVASAASGSPFPRERFARAYEALVCADDHSYGFSGYSGRRVYDTWAQRLDWIETAEKAAGCAPVRAEKTLRPLQETRRAPCSARRLLENRWYRVSFLDDGAILSIFDKELGRELLAAPANGLFYTRDRYASWSDPSALRARRMASSVRLADDRKAVLVENEIEGAADLLGDGRLRRYGHYAFPFAFERPRFVAQTNGAVLDPFRDVLPHVANSYCCIRDWCAVEDGDCGVALIQPDTWVMEFGRQHGAEAYLREEPPASAAMWSLAFGDGLRWHWDKPPSFRFRYVITSYAGSWRDAHVPAFASREVGALSADPAIARAVSSDATNVELVALKAAEDGSGWIARFRETEGRETVAAFRQRLVPGASPVRCDLAERPVAEMPGGVMRLAPFGFATVLIPSPAGIPLAAETTPWTGLLSGQRAFPGRDPGQMYLLWGAEADAVAWDVFRDGAFVARVPRESSSGVAFACGRFEDRLAPERVGKVFYRVRPVLPGGVPGQFGPEFGPGAHHSSETSLLESET